MIYFSQRKEIEKKYREWIKEKDLRDCAFNEITFLSIPGLLVETMDAAVFATEMERMCDYYARCADCPVEDLYPDMCSDRCHEVLIKRNHKGLLE